MDATIGATSPVLSVTAGTWRQALSQLHWKHLFHPLCQWGWKGYPPREMKLMWLIIDCWALEPSMGITCNIVFSMDPLSTAWPAGVCCHRANIAHVYQHKLKMVPSSGKTSGTSVCPNHELSLRKMQPRSFWCLPRFHYMMEVWGEMTQWHSHGGHASGRIISSRLLGCSWTPGRLKPLPWMMITRLLMFRGRNTHYPGAVSGGGCAGVALREGVSGTAPSIDWCPTGTRAVCASFSSRLTWGLQLLP